MARKDWWEHLEAPGWPSESSVAPLRQGRAALLFCRALGRCRSWGRPWREGQPPASLSVTQVNGQAALGKYEGCGDGSSAAGQSLYVANHAY